MNESVFTSVVGGLLKTPSGANHETALVKEKHLAYSI